MPTPSETSLRGDMTGYDGADIAYAKFSGGILIFTSVLTGEFVEFPAYLKDFSQNFTSNWNDINPKFSYSLQNKKILWIATPMAWAVHYGFSSQFDGYISRIIKNNLSFCIKYRDYIDRELREILTRRIHLCNEMMRFLQDKGLKHGLYRFAHIKKSPL